MDRKSQNLDFSEWTFIGDESMVAVHQLQSQAAQVVVDEIYENFEFAFCPKSYTRAAPYEKQEDDDDMVLSLYPFGSDLNCVVQVNFMQFMMKEQKGYHKGSEILIRELRRTADALEAMIVESQSDKAK